MATSFKKPTLYYIYDGLCGWCFGFAPVMERIAETFANEMKVEVLSGGMVTGSRIGPATEMAAYIRQAAPRVTELTGQVFGVAYLHGVLSSSDFISNSVPPSIALCILKEAYPDKAVHFAHAIQNLLFIDGQDINKPEAYLPLAEEAGVGKAEFLKKFKDILYRNKAEQEFEIAQHWGISGFPAVVVEKDDKLYLVSQGFQAYEPLVDTIGKVLRGEPVN